MRKFLKVCLKARIKQRRQMILLFMRFWKRWCCHAYTWAALICIAGWFTPAILDICNYDIHAQRQGILLWVWSLSKNKSNWFCRNSLTQLLLDRLIEWFGPGAVTERQWEFRAGRVAIDMSFRVRQLIEKYIEQQMSLYQAFIDIYRAFDTELCRSC